jgi:hypothetical protein
MIVPWDDPVVDRVGFDVRSQYVEMFWLSVLGPSAMWIIRRMVAGFGRYPLGYEIELAELASTLGLSFARGASSPFQKSLQRLVMFGVSQPVDGALAVRVKLPPVANRHLQRMPAPLQRAHERWRVDAGDHAANSLAHERARVLTDAMVTAGDQPEQVIRQLTILGIDADVAEMATTAAFSRGYVPMS